MYLISDGTAKMKLAILVFLCCEEGKGLSRHFLQTLQIKLDKEDFLADYPWRRVIKNFCGAQGNPAQNSINLG